GQRRIETGAEGANQVRGGSDQLLDGRYRVGGVAARVHGRALDRLPQHPAGLIDQVHSRIAARHHLGSKASVGAGKGLELSDFQGAGCVGGSPDPAHPRRGDGDQRRQDQKPACFPHQHPPGIHKGIARSGAIDVLAQLSGDSTGTERRESRTSGQFHRFALDGCATMEYKWSTRYRGNPGRRKKVPTMSAIAEKGAKSPPTAGAARAETRHPKSARLQARLSPKQQELLARAAALEGRTLSQFVLTHAQAAAQKTIAEHRALALSAQDSR